MLEVLGAVNAPTKTEIALQVAAKLGLEVTNIPLSQLENFANLSGISFVEVADARLEVLASLFESLSTERPRTEVLSVLNEIILELQSIKRMLREK